ncbi:MAG: zeta toxin family protein [Microbacterium sp.]|uniref:zeta toxin family protein n=1 Tax=Microbacterium sp. TaxID=51671 RepID=UPI003F823A1C
MSDPEQAADWREDVLRRDILPLYFPAGDPAGSPEFVLLAGQPGSGRLRAARPAGLAGVPVVDAAELQAYHPDYARLHASRAPEAVMELTQTARGWVATCIRHARETRRSVVLDGAFLDPVVAARAAEGFAAAGFTTRLVIAGSRRAESLLTVTSAHLQDLLLRHPSVMVTVDAHDDGLDATRRLAASLEEAGWVDRVTVLTRAGQVTYDANRRADAAGFGDVLDAVTAAQSERMNRWDATQWLSELHHVTDYATSLRVMPDGVGEVLVELHEIALREVIPELHVPTDGTFRSAIEQKTRTRLTDLRQATRVEPAVDAAAPILVPGGPETGGPSR